MISAVSGTWQDQRRCGCGRAERSRWKDRHVRTPAHRTSCTAVAESSPSMSEILPISNLSNILSMPARHNIHTLFHKVVYIVKAKLEFLYWLHIVFFSEICWWKNFENRLELQLKGCVGVFMARSVVISLTTTSGPGSAVGRLCVCAFVRMIAFERNDLWPKYT